MRQLLFGDIWYQTNQVNLATISFKKALSFEENAEPMLGLASCLRTKDINKAIVLAKKALVKEPKYVDYDYRKEQLWGEKIQSSTEELFSNKQLENEILLAKRKIN